MKLLDNIDIGIIICNEKGKIIYTNKYVKNYFPNKMGRLDVYSFFPELRNNEVLNKNFKTLTKNHNDMSYMLFYQPEIKNRYTIFMKSREFFQAFSNDKPNNFNPQDKQSKYSFENVIGKSPQIKKVIEEAKKVANGNSNLLITGESGTGKEFFARAIHNFSSRKDYPFIAVNCGSIPSELIESELFGYEAGAFTGANKNGYMGKFELANGGTIFLDEIGEMPLSMQVSLLRVLQDKCITRIGGKKSTLVDVRIIAATNRDLNLAIGENKFRKDLFYRLNAFNLCLPPLKERMGDIPIFLEYLLHKKSIELKKPIQKVPDDLFKKVISYCWPGNIRELENFVENFLVLEGKSTYHLNFDECHCMVIDNLGNKIEKDISISKKDNEKKDEKIYTLVELEKNEIKKALKKYNGNITKSAKALGISRNALYVKMKRFDIEKN